MMLSEKQFILRMSKHGLQGLGTFRTSSVSVIPLQGHEALKSLTSGHRWPGEGSSFAPAAGGSTSYCGSLDLISNLGPLIQKIHSANKHKQPIFFFPVCRQKVCAHGVMRVMVREGLEKRRMWLFCKKKLKLIEFQTGKSLRDHLALQLSDLQGSLKTKGRGNRSS